MIPRKQIEGMFERMREESGWELNAPLLWGFFFTSDSPDALERACAQLENEGYRKVKVYQDEHKEHWWLHVEREEVHTVDSIDRRNQELSTFANRMGLSDYDGMDVGPVTQK